MPAFAMVKVKVKVTLIFYTVV
ncbi:hypothetical protein AERO9A_180042 [Aeromonas salmonicida]|nr:hypothetical protein AERO9A_180042 [Aeromonas salmonicida]